MIDSRASPPDRAKPLRLPGSSARTKKEPTASFTGGCRPQETTEGRTGSGLGPAWTQGHRRGLSRTASRQRAPKQVESPAPLQGAARHARPPPLDYDEMTPNGASLPADHDWVCFSDAPLEKERQDLYGTSGPLRKPLGDLQVLRQAYRRSRIEVPSRSPEVP